MFTLVRINTDTYRDGVKHFLSSLGWTYITYRYPSEAQGFLLRALTLSGQDPWSWERSVVQLIHQPESGIAHLLADIWLGPPQTFALPHAVELIRTHAQQQGKRLGEPPTAPTYLVEYEYSHQAYLEDLEKVYGLPLDPCYLEPWPDAQESQPELPLMLQPNLLQKAVAIMGATAGAIEQLMSIGAAHEHRN